MDEISAVENEPRLMRYVRAHTLLTFSMPSSVTAAPLHCIFTTISSGRRARVVFGEILIIMGGCCLQPPSFLRSGEGNDGMLMCLGSYFLSVPAAFSFDNMYSSIILAEASVPIDESIIRS